MPEKFTVMFEYTLHDKVYKCFREVTGHQIQTQSIGVHGFGTKSDAATYGPGARPVESMSSAADIIASEIIASGR